jgi:hypothetical protein
VAIEETELSEERHARKRAAVTLGALAVVAVLVVVLIVLLSGGPSKKHSSAIADNRPPSASARSTRPAAPPASAHSSPAPPTSSSQSASASPSAKRKPQRVAGDRGDVLGAINAFRARHGVHRIPGAVTTAAVACAAGSGDQSSCPSSYFWEPVSGADGAQVVQKIVAQSTGAQFLLDPSLKRVQIGWKSMGNGEWECAVVGGY